MHAHQYVAQRTEADSIFPTTNATIAEKELKHFFPDGWDAMKDDVMEAFGYLSSVDDAGDVTTSGPGTAGPASGHEQVLDNDEIRDLPLTGSLTSKSVVGADGQTAGSATSGVVDPRLSDVEADSAGAASGCASSTPHNSVSLSVLDFLRDSGVNVKSML